MTNAKMVKVTKAESDQVKETNKCTQTNFRGFMCALCTI